MCVWFDPDEMHEQYVCEDMCMIPIPITATSWVMAWLDPNMHAQYMYVCIFVHLFTWFIIRLQKIAQNKKQLLSFTPGSLHA